MIVDPLPGSGVLQWIRRFFIAPECSANRKVCRGFSLLEMMLVLTVMAGLVTAFVTLMPQFQKPVSNEKQLQILHQADRQLRGFAVANGRLPCPDINGDGLEQCGSGTAIGALPYKTLALGSASFGTGRIALRYGVYRNASINADLTILKDRFNPTDADGVTTVQNKTNSLDFCDALDSAAASASATNFLYQRDSSGNNRNIAYAVAVSGAMDADGVGGLFDGLNGQAGVGFVADNIAPSAIYDDRVLARDFTSLGNSMNCDVTRNSLDILANALALQNEVTDQAAGTLTGAIQNSVLAGAGLILAGVDTALAGVAVVSAGVALGTAIGGLGSAIAGCFALVGCGFIASFAAAVAFATTGLALAGVALALNGGALASAIVAAGLYTAVLIRAGGATSASGVDLAQSVIDLQTGLTKANADLTQAQTDETTAKATATNTSNNLTANKNSVIAQLDGVIASATAILATTPAPTVAVQAQTDINNANVAKISLQTALNAETTLDQKDLALQNATTQTSTAQASLDSKKSMRDVVTLQKNCNDAGNYYDVTKNPNVCRARVAGDPPQSISQTQLNNANNDVTTAQTQLNNANATQVTAQTAFDLAVTAEASARTAAINDVNAALSPLLPVVSVTTILDAQRTLPQEQRAADTATQNRIEAENRVASLQANLAQMQCLAAGNVYDTTVTPAVCNPPSAAPGGSASSVFNGASAILQSADGLGVAK